MKGNKIDRYMQHAKDVSLMSDFKKFHIGCVAVLNNKIISVGFNSDKTHPIQQKYNKYRFEYEELFNIKHKLHAEIHCLLHIMDLDIPWNKVELYIYRSTKSKPFGLAKPCKACMALIKQLGIKNIYYTSDNNIIIKEKIN